ncbi:ATPase AAA [Candidatus Magnetomorum sp. HK-1]|nr:ATPase AAA [Candidatus Magnetomorum sp. HK-1]
MNRKILTDLVHWKEKQKRKPLLLKGARQVGKTYILKHFGEKNFNALHYINFEEDETLCKLFEENLRPERILRDLSFYVDASIRSDRDLIFFDEIQACPRALTCLKYFCEKMPGLAICAAGSLLGIQLGDTSFPVGKVDEVEMYPMSFEEFLEASEENKALEYLKISVEEKNIPEILHYHLWDQLKIYFIVGGLPEVVQTYVDLKDDLYYALNTARKTQKLLINAYLADVAKHSGKENAMHIERIFKNIPLQLAKEQDGNIPKYKFKGVIPGVNTYSRMAGAIDWLLTAGLIIKIHIAQKARLPLSAFSIENQFKLCLFDIGILGAISNLSPSTIIKYDYGSYKGYVAENFVAQEFICSGLNPLFSWKEKTAEIEFLLEKNGALFPVEIKSGWVTQAKSMKVFNEKYQPKYMTIMSAKNLKFNPNNNIHYFPLYMTAQYINNFI